MSRTKEPSICHQIERMRLFIAIRLSEEMKASLLDVQERMYAEGVSGRYSPEENLHLTLAFIGECPDPEFVVETMETVSFTPFELSLSGFGSFGDLWWAGLAESRPLEAVVRRLRRALAENNIPFDKKKFRPHITLIRKASCKNGLPKIETPEIKMQVEAISLMRSDRGKDGMIYTEVAALFPEG